MKTVLIIGMGRFGHHLASNMISLGNEVMIVDKDESRLEDLTKLISNIKIGDCTNEEVLRSLGVGNFEFAQRIRSQVCYFSSNKRYTR